LRIIARACEELFCLHGPSSSRSFSNLLQPWHAFLCIGSLWVFINIFAFTNHCRLLL
jgi:hypothetical protein